MGVKALVGGLPPTLQLQDLNLALGLADSSTALAQARMAEAGSVAAGWDPVLSLGFLKGLQAQLETLWGRLGFVGEEACGPSGVMRQYMHSGQLPKQLPRPGV